MTQLEKELIESLKELVSLHRDWDKGSAYIPVAFIEKNNEAIQKASAIIKGATK